MSDISRPASNERKTKANARHRVNKACVVCRRRKIKCNGVEPCTNCETSGLICSFELKPHRASVYKQEEEIRKELRTMASYRKGLDNLTYMGREELATLVSQMETTLKTYRDQLRLTVSPDAIANYSNTSSIETALVEVSPIIFNQYEQGLFREPSDNYKRLPLSIYFGMYSVLTLFSNNGFGWLFKKMFRTSLDQEETKKTFYLYLKFFDLSSLWFQLNTTQIGAPLEYCKKHYKPAFQNAGSTMDLVVDMMNDISAVIEDNDIRFSGLSLENPSRIITQLVRLVRKHSAYYKQKSGLVTPLDVKQLYMTEEYIHLIFMEFFQKATCTSFFEDRYVEDILDYLDCVFWKEEYVTINGIVSTIVSRAVNIGMNRWEYYIGMSEEQADKARQVWWRCFWWDKWASTLAGKSSLLQNDSINCLLPRRWMEVGIDESMSLDILIKSLDYEAAYSSGVLYEASYYILAKLIDFNNVSIIYNKRFTDFRIFSSNFNDIDTVVDELLDITSNILSLFDLFRSKMAPYFDKIDKTGPELDFFVIFHFCHNEVLSSIENLIIRILSHNNIKEESKLRNRLDELGRSIFEVSRVAIEKLIVNNSLFESIRLMKLSSISIIRIVTFAVDHPDEGMLSSAILLCKFMGRFAFENQHEIYDLDNRYVFDLQPTFTLIFSFILVRIFLQTLINVKIVTQEELLGYMTDSESLDMCKLLLDISSWCFAPLLQDIEMSPMHREVLKSINEMTGCQFFANFKRPVNQGNDGRQFVSLHTPTEDLVSLVNLDEFLALDIFPHVYEAVWQNFNTPSPDL